MSKQTLTVQPTNAPLLEDLRALIGQARRQTAQAVNSTLTLLYWRVGKRIRQEVLRQTRAEYGEQIVSTLSTQLTHEYGKGFGVKNLARMIQFAEVFPDEQIVVTLIRQLSWTHFLALLPLKQHLEREYYVQMCSIERWSVRTLRERITSQLYLRTSISKKPEAIVEHELKSLRETGQMTPDMVFRDPYVLDFLSLPNHYSESDLENRILADMERFLLELGSGFTFVARQKRMSIGSDDFYLDLLFYHRHLHRLVALELKLEKFQAAHKGQMELYLRWLDKHERAAGEEAPIGLILCAQADSEQVELLDVKGSNIRVAEYLAHIPDIKLLREQLHRSLLHAQEQSHAVLMWVGNGKDTNKKEHQK